MGGKEIKMKIGVSTSCFYPLETELAFEKIAKAGIKTAEVFFNAECELKQDFVDILLKIQHEYGIDIVSVHPTMSLAESFMLFSAYDRRLKAGIESYRRYSEIAAMFGARYIIMHGGKPNGVLENGEYCERYMLLQDVARQNGVSVLQENVLRHRAGDIEFLASMQEILGKDAQFCIDVKQALRCGYDPYELIERFSGNIKHFHISDHSEESDCLLPGRGEFDFDEFFRKTRALGYDGAYIVEVYRNAYNEYGEIFNSYNFLKTLKNA